MIEVKNLVKRYGSHVAVDHLSFTVEKGQIYGFLGPNGAGKSTTMNIMTGYLAPTEGEVLINGIDMLEEPDEAKKYIGYLPEIPPLYPDMTVWEYLTFCAELKGIPKKKRAEEVKSAMELTKLEDRKNSLIRSLSKGYKQRVGLAQAVLGLPEIIILDEPTVGLDPMQIIEIRDLIRMLAQNHTILLSSHILSEVSAVCDKIMIISKGKLVANDTPDHLEEAMEGASTLEVTMKAEKPAAEKLLRSVEGIRHFTVRDSDEEGVVSVTIEEEAKEDIRECLFYKCAEAKAPILSMQSVKATLEDIFLELTSDEGETDRNRPKENAGPEEAADLEESEASKEDSKEEKPEKTEAEKEEQDVRNL